MKKIVAFLLLIIVNFGSLFSQNVPFDGIQNNMGNLFLLSDAKSRSISPENFSGEKGRGGMAKLGEGSASNAARDLGQGWKVNPYIKTVSYTHLRAHETGRNLVCRLLLEK